MTNTSKLGFIFHQTQQNKSAFFFPEKQHCHSDISYNLKRTCFITLTIYTDTFLSSSAYYFWHVKRPKESECSIFFHDQNDRSQARPLAHSNTMRYEQLYISLSSSFFGLCLIIYRHVFLYTSFLFSELCSPSKAILFLQH